MEGGTSLIRTLLNEPRTRVAIASIAATTPLIWGGLMWVSHLAFMGQLIVGIIIGVATMASFHYMGVHRSHKRMQKAVTVQQLNTADAAVLKRFLPISSLPSWIQNITDFERTTWINRELEEVWPFLDQAASEMIRLQLQPILDQYKFGPITGLNLKSATLGKIAPLIGGVKFTAVGKNEAMIEVEVDWRHGHDQKIVLEVQTSGPDFNVQVKDFVFYGIFRAILKPLTDQIPCFGAVVVSMREPPQIDFKTKFLGGDVLQLPGVDSMIDEIIKTAITDMLVWPSRMVIPILPGDYSFLESKPVAYLEVKIIEGRHLLNKEIFGKSDPFVYLYVRQKQELMQRTVTKSNTSNPVWNQDFIVDVEDPETQKLYLRVMDSDKMDSADFIGYAEIPIKELEPNVAKDMWIKLVKDPAKPKSEDKDRGELHLVVTFKPFKGPDKKDEPKELLPSVPEGAGVKPIEQQKEEKKQAEEKKDISTPANPESGTLEDAKVEEVKREGAANPDGGNGNSKVTAGGLVLNQAGKQALNNERAEAPQAPAQDNTQVAKEGAKPEADVERETMHKFVEDESTAVQ